MQCHPCGKPVASGTFCRSCQETAAGSTAASRILVTDGGDEREDDDEETYLAPDEIVGDDIEDGSADREETDTEAETPPDEPADPEPSTTDSGEVQGEQGAVDEEGPDGGGPEPADEQQREPPARSDRGSAEEQAPGEPAGDEPGDVATEQGGPGDGATEQEMPASPPPGQEIAPGQLNEVGDPPQGSGRPDQRQGGRPGGSPQGAARQGQPAGRDGHQHSQGSPVERIQEYPVKLGAALGAVAFLVLYVLITVAVYWAYEESPLADPKMGPFDVGAEVFLTVVGLGSGQRVVDFFIGMADVDVRSPGEVDPSNYPTVEDQLGPLLSLLDSNPEVPLLIVYLVAPYALFVVGRYLARHYSPSETTLDCALAGATVALGTLPVVFVVATAFETFALLERIVFVGLVFPAGFGALGGLSIRFFDEQPAMVSTLFGWGAIAAGIVIATAVLPLPALGLGDGGLDLSLLDRLVLGLGMVLNVLEFNVGTHLQGRLLFVLVAAVTVAAGFLRTWRVEEPIDHRMDGARIGASIWLGFVATVAVLLWVFPMSTVLVDVSLSGDLVGLVAGIEGDAVEGLGSVAVPTVQAVVDVDSYFHTIAVAGFIFPAMFGGIGGYLAVWYNERTS